MRYLILSTLLMAVSGCEWSNHMADKVSNYNYENLIPEIDDDCENWECFSESGRQKSDAIKQAKLREQQKMPKPKPLPAPSKTPLPNDMLENMPLPPENE